ncbi:MAG: PaaI family thioesterase [Solirubrobacterales bacterium]
MNDLPNPAVPLDEDLNAALGFTVDEIEIDRVTGHAPVTNKIKQPFGIVHGGAHAAFAETLASVGTYRAVAEAGKVAMGMSNQTQFLRSVTEGTIHAEAKAIHRGSTTWVWDVELTDDQNRVVAVSRVTIAVRELRS